MSVPKCGIHWCVALAAPARRRRDETRPRCAVHRRNEKYRPPAGKKERWIGHWYKPLNALLWPWDGNVASPTRPPA